jgi:hypothetical protein
MPFGLRSIALTIAMLVACGPNGSAPTRDSKPTATVDSKPAAPADSKPAMLRTPMPVAELDQYRACVRDDDCVWVTNGCCDCANGGIEVAIARSQKAAFEARFDCSNLPCTRRGREIECGTGSVACENALCVFRAAGSSGR